MARTVTCISNELGDVWGGDLSVGKTYQVISEENGMFRIVDDSGEDFLYPIDCFAVERRSVPDA